jgi:hypothetical protein
MAARLAEPAVWGEWGRARIGMERVPRVLVIKRRHPAWA